nr:hypothetical protein [Tanacetum cinerariifolium]
MNANELPEMDPYEEVAQQGHVPPLSPAYVLEPMELGEHVPVYISEPEHPEYNAPSDDDIQVEDQPHADDASPTAKSPGYIADLNSMGEDDDEDTKEDPSEEHEPEDDDEDPKEDPNKEHEPEDKDTKEDEPSEGSDETEPFKEDETAVTPPPPRHRRARISASLGNRAAMICRSDDIPEEDMPPQRRFVFTAPSHGCDVTESSSAAARAPRGQYDFDDVVEAGQGLICSPGHDAQTIARVADRAEDVGYVRALQASEHRMMTSIEETDRKDIRLEIDVVRGQRAAYEKELQEALLAQLETLETHMSCKEWQRQRVEDLAVTQMIRHVQPARVCSYTDFMKCQPLNFKGTKGVVGLSQWLKKMESVFYISSCAIDNQVKFATCTLLGAVLTWWNGHVRTLGHDAAYVMTWGTLKNKLTEKYCPKELALMCTKFLTDEPEKVDKYINGLPNNICVNVMSARPKTLDETIELANDLTDQKLRTYAKRHNDNKRKANDSSRNNQQQQPHKKKNVARAYTTGPSEKRAYTGNLPLCTKCNYHRTRQCTPKCGNCKRYGHPTKDCRNCPKLKNHENGNGNGVAKGKAYALRGGDSNLKSNTVTGMFLLNNRYALILFDTGADRSFVSTAFSALLNIAPTALDNHYDVKLADGKIIGVNAILRGCTLDFLNYPFNIDLMPVPLGSFDVIIGMDWLREYHAVIVCDEKIVRVPFGNETLIFQDKRNDQVHES